MPRSTDPSLAIREVLDVARDALADLDAARAQDAATIAELRAELSTALATIEALQAAMPR